MAIVDNVMVVIEKLEATIAKHERREDSHVKRIEELISSKGIRDLEVVAEAIVKELNDPEGDGADRVIKALREAGYLK